MAEQAANARVLQSRSYCEVGTLTSPNSARSPCQHVLNVSMAGFATCATTFANSCLITSRSACAVCLPMRAAAFDCSCQEPKFEKRSNFNEINEAWIGLESPCSRPVERICRSASSRTATTSFSSKLENEKTCAPGTVFQSLLTSAVRYREGVGTMKAHRGHPNVSVSMSRHESCDYCVLQLKMKRMLDLRPKLCSLRAIPETLRAFVCLAVAASTRKFLIGVDFRQSQDYALHHCVLWFSQLPWQRHGASKCSLP